MLRRLRFLVALFAALALPLEAAAGVVMPLGGSSAEAAAAAAAEDMAAMADDCPMQHQPAPSPSPSRDCGHCGVCHLAAAGFIAASTVTPAVLAVGETYAAVRPAAPASHIPEPPQQPPKRTA